MTSLKVSTFSRLALVAGMLGACSDDSGLLIEVTRSESAPAMDRLEIYAGTDVAGRDGQGFADQAPDDAVALGGRDLLADPYRVLLAPTDASADHQVMVAVLGFHGDQLVGFGALAEPVPFLAGKVARWTVVVDGTLPDGFGLNETGCLSWITDDGSRIVIGQPPDQDCDGYTDDDCDDLDPAANPGAIDVCGNGVNEDCDGATDEDVDDDGDSFTSCGGDCDDRDVAINPDAAEVCDGADNNCDLACDAGFDLDGDRFTPCGSKLKDDGRCEALEPEFVDCDDGDEHRYPFADEVCDGVDNDCNEVCDDNDELDPDGDRYTACGSIVGFCELDSGNVDCQADDGAIHPGAVELCNGEDDDCDGEFLESAPCFAVLEPDAGCHLGSRPCDEVGVGDFSAACEPSAAADSLVSDALCQAYLTCDGSGEVDPYACATEAAAAGLACSVGYDPVASAQCANQRQPLPTGGSDTCTWAVVGGVDHGAYRVGLAAIGDGTPQPTGPCASALVIELVDTNRPAPETVLLAHTDNAVTTVVRVAVVAEPTATCNPPSGLACVVVDPIGP